MSNWNQHYTYLKQKEMLKKAVDDDKKNPLNPNPLYRPLYGNSSIARREQQVKHDKFCWRVGFVIVTVLIGLFIWAMIEIL